MIKRNGGEASETRSQSDHGNSKLFEGEGGEEGGILTADATRICRISGRRARKEKLKGLPRENRRATLIKICRVVLRRLRGPVRFLLGFGAATRGMKLFVPGFGILELRERMTSGKPRGLAAVEADLPFDVRLFQEISSFNCETVGISLGGERGKDCLKNKGKEENREEKKKMSRNNLIEKSFYQ